MLDDVQIGYFDSSVEKLVFFRQEGTKKEKHILQDGVHALNYHYFAMQERMSSLTQSFNLTTGIHVYQRIAGCEIMNNSP